MPEPVVEPIARGPIDADVADEAPLDVLARIKAQLAKATGLALESVDVDRAFIDSGVDSLIAVDMVGALGAELGVPLKTTTLFDHPTVRSLARHVVEQFPQIVEARRAPPVQLSAAPSQSSAMPVQTSATPSQSISPRVQSISPPRETSVPSPRQSSRSGARPGHAALVIHGPRRLESIEL
jgi:acyl carrier protein